MKSLNFTSVAALILLFGCGNPTEKAKSPAAPDTPKTKNAVVLPDDTVTITIDSNTRAAYKWGQLRNILKVYPAFNDKSVRPPYMVYKQSMALHKPMNAAFNSEAGQDNFYGLYTYFLKKKMDTAKYTPETRNLVKIYHYLNNIYSNLAQGGTYFIHQDIRIPAYAWYAVYLGSDSAKRQPGFASQKAAYLTRLKRLVARKITGNKEMSAKQQGALKKKLYDKINDTGNLITNSFYLKATQDFQSAWYKN